MNNFISLTKVLLKNISLGLNQKKKASTIILYLILVLSMLPLLFGLYKLFVMGFEFCTPFNQTTSFFAMVMQLCSMLIFMFGIFIIPSFYYFGDDLEVLLRLPLKPHTIIASKFVQCLVSELLFVLMLMVPLGIAYFVVEGFSLISLILMIIISFVLPIYPLVICSFIVMVMMRFTPFFKNRDRFQLIAGFVGVIFALFISWGCNQLLNPTSQSELIYMFVSGDLGLAHIFTRLFPALSLGSKAIVHLDWISFLLFIGFHIVLILVFLYVANLLYFKGAIGISQTGSKKAKKQNQEIQHTVSSPYFSFLKKEIIVLLKTPAYALNCVGMVVIFPVSVMIGILSGGGDLDLSIFSYFSFEGYEGLMLIIGICGGAIFASFNQTSSTALSREGTNYIFMKYIPVSYKTQMLAKVSSGIMVSVLMMMISFGIGYYYFPYLPFYDYILIIVSALITLVFFNFIALIIDFMHPKLVWDNETAAVKQNLFTAISMILALAITAILIVSLFFIAKKWWLLIGGSITFTMLVATIFIYIHLEKIGSYCMKRL